MQYREILLDLILNQPEDALDNWMSTQAPLDQVEILKELKLLAEELSHEIEEALPADLLNSFDADIEEYQEAILDEKVAELQLEIAEDNLDKTMQEVNETIQGVRTYVIECITTGAPNAKEMRALAEQIMELEKRDGVYSEENWKAIL
jgi:hypothetical protein